jgi:hypothetical protein
MTSMQGVDAQHASNWESTDGEADEAEFVELNSIAGGIGGVRVGNFTTEPSGLSRADGCEAELRTVEDLIGKFPPGPSGTPENEEVGSARASDLVTLDA